MGDTSPARAAPEPATQGTGLSEAASPPADQHRTARGGSQGLPRVFALLLSVVAGVAWAYQGIGQALARASPVYAFALLVVGAALAFTTGGIFMKLSEGLTKPLPSLLVMAFFICGAVLQTLAMRGEDLGVTYIIILGAEAVLAFLFGWALFGETVTAIKIAGVVAIVAGIAVLRY